MVGEPTSATSVGPASASAGKLSNGLTAEEARTRLRTSGPNAMPDTTIRALPGFDTARVLSLAALASSDGGQEVPLFARLQIA